MLAKNDVLTKSKSHRRTSRHMHLFPSKNTLNGKLPAENKDDEREKN